MHTDDLCKLQDTTEISLVEILQERYLSNRIYTNAGMVLISINPYTKLDLYGKNVMNAYFNSSSCDPHIYSVIESAFQDMKQSNQTIMISGESGSGKTENTKYIQEYLIARTGTSNLLKEKIDALTIILESFGNARTILNDNSSRVGKMISYYINEKIQGVKINTFLLEKSRVTHQSKGEANFNIFYQLCKYKKINITNDYIDSKNSVKGDYKEVKKALEILEFKDIVFIENILLVILYFGFMQINYKKTGNSINKETELRIKNENINFICETLKIERAHLENILLKKEIKVNDEVMIKMNTPEEAITIRDSISRILYTKVFDYIVDKINNNLNTNEGPCINILDIFGFEIFKENSLDQLCINYANEKIHYDFVKKVFTEKQKEYQEELENYKFIPYSSNFELINELERRCGLFDLIDEESKNKFGSTDNLRNKITNYIKKCIKVKSDNKLLVRHFVRDVEYEISDFIVKNRQVKIDKEVLKIFSGPSVNSTVISSFLMSLFSLSQVINSTQVKYIRCIKPNETKSNRFDKNIIYNQLMSTGILEVIKISKQIFTYEMDKKEWYEKYYKYKKISEGKTKVYFNIDTKLGIESSERIRNDRKKKVLDWFMEKLLEKKEGMNRLPYYADNNLNNETQVDLENGNCEESLIKNCEESSLKNCEDMISEHFKEIENMEDEIISNELAFKDISSNDSPSIEMCEIDKEGIKFKDHQKSKKDPESVKFESTSTTDNIEEGSISKGRIPPPNKTQKVEDKFSNFISKPPSTEEDIALIFESEEDDSTLFNFEDIQIERPSEKAPEDLLNLENVVPDHLSNDDNIINKVECNTIDEEILAEKSDTKEDSNDDLREVKNDILNNAYVKEVTLSEVLTSPEQNNNTEYQETVPRNQVSFVLPEDLQGNSEEIQSSTMEAHECVNCRNLELKYKFVSEALKEAKEKLSLLSEGGSPMLENASSLFSKLFHLYLENIPSGEIIPRSEMLSFAHSAFLVTKRVNKNTKESASIFVEEISLRLKYFEKNINSVVYFLSNLIEYSKLVNEEVGDLRDLINNLFIYLSEYYVSSLREFIPFSITEHQELPNFKCSDSFIKKIFRPVSITKLIKALQIINDQMEYYCLDKDYKTSIIDNILSNINAGVFNNLLVKKNFLSFNRCIQINYNINQINNLLNEIGHIKSRGKLGHIMDVIKLINIKEKEEIKKYCKILTGVQIKAFLMKMDNDYHYEEDEDEENVKFISSEPLRLIRKVTKAEENFVMPRYISSEELSFVFK